MSVLLDYLSELEGQPVAVLAARYWYRGILVRADPTGIVLTNPRAVQDSGPSTGSEPNSEDVIPSDILIRTDFVELVCQPAWCFHELGT